RRSSRAWRVPPSATARPSGSSNRRGILDSARPVRLHERVNRTPAILVAALTAMSLAACASATSASPREGSASSGEPAAEPDVPVQVADGTSARGALVLADGSSFGEASSDWGDGGIVVHVPDLAPLRSGGSSIMPALADGEV